MKTKRVLSKICSISSLLLLLCIQTAQTHAAPQVEATLAASTVSTGTPFTLSITVSWQGDADQYVIVPPEPELPDGVEKLSSSFISSASADMQTMHYSFLVRALKNGDYTIQPATVKYWARGEKKESTAASGKITFKAVRFALVENTATRVFIICVALLAVAVSGMGFVVLKRKKALRQKQAAGGETGANTQAAELLQICRQSKLRGDYAEFFKTALDLARMVAPQDSALSGNLAAMCEKVQFGGVRPPAEEIERLLRQLEKSSGEILSGNKKNEPDYRKYCK
ncbi:MAG: hypothetical protein JW832_17415 [Deltaproteobacteria bacterium]|nr:hypothetical protein [Deltaproteobacteria bacterium]